MLVHHNNFATILSEFRHKSVGIFEEEILLLTCQVSVHGVVGRPALRGGGSKQGRPRPAYSNPLSPLLSLQHLICLHLLIHFAVFFMACNAHPNHLTPPCQFYTKSKLCLKIAPSGAPHSSEHKFCIREIFKNNLGEGAK